MSFHLLTAYVIVGAEVPLVILMPDSDLSPQMIAVYFSHFACYISNPVFLSKKNIPNPVCFNNISTVFIINFEKKEVLQNCWERETKIVELGNYV